MTEPRFRPCTESRELPPAEMAARAREFRLDFARRRTVRHVDRRPVPLAIIAECLQAAGGAPSGANRQEDL